MSRIHEDLPYKDFQAPDTVEKTTVCARTLKLANYNCPTVTEYMDVANLPTERCSGDHSNAYQHPQDNESGYSDYDSDYDSDDNYEEDNYDSLDESENYDENSQDNSGESYQSENDDDDDHYDSDDHKEDETDDYSYDSDSDEIHSDDHNGW